MRHELEHFYLMGKEKDWFCHVDDDNYLNVPQLVSLLSKYDPNKDIYIGRPRLAQPLDLDWGIRQAPLGLGNFNKEPFWFGTGGAGFCLSRNLAKKMEPYVRDGKFEKLCEFIRLPDDCTIGFLSESVLGVKMMHSQLLHSHLERQNVPHEQLKAQVTFSHGLLGSFESLIPIDGPFTREEDPTRFKSYHCLLNPHLKWCPQ
jgi:fringe protein